jgi:hypothetical protein
LSTSFAQATTGAAAVSSIVPIGWSAPVTVDVSPPFAAPIPFSAVACPKANWCLAGDVNGNLLFSSDPGGGVTVWHQTSTGFRAQFAQLICPTTSFCLAVVGEPPYAIFTSADPTGKHSAWHRLRKSLPGDISCPSTQFCVSSSVHGLTYSTDPTAGTASTWKSVTLTQLTTLTGVSCASSIFCLATDSAGNVLRLDKSGQYRLGARRPVGHRGVLPDHEALRRGQRIGRHPDRYRARAHQDHHHLGAEVRGGRTQDHREVPGAQREGRTGRNDSDRAGHGQLFRPGQMHRKVFWIKRHFKR